ncbi:MAG: hypothetical protein QNK03_24195, partial [Myxococcota bacterium]|nr:hypothetical protein [Myxococcota bacterium]
GGVPSAEFQRRIAGSCPSGSSIRAIDPDGGVVCADDTGAFFAAGEGLQLVGTRFAVDGDVVQLRVANGCPPGSFIRDIGADGTVTCEPDDDTDTTLAAGLGLTLFDGIFETDAAVVQRRVTGACPAGQAIASIRSDGAVACVATNGGDIDGVLAPAGSGLDAIGCGSGTCTLRVDANETQRAIGSCPADFGVAAVDALGNVTCVELFAGTAESLRTTSGLTGGCESGTCDLSIDPDVIQRRITSSCPSGSAMRSAQDFADVSCQSVFPGDITAIETQSGRGLDGGCTSDRCELSLAPGDFFRTRYESETGADVVGTTFPNGQVIEQASITAPASFGGRVLAIATATAYCGNDCISGLGTGLGAVLLTDDRSQNMLIQPETRRVTSTRDDWTTVVLQRTFSLSAGEPLTVYLRAYSDVVDFSELSIASARVSLAFIPF